jgi:hypothetical protein
MKDEGGKSKDEGGRIKDEGATRHARPTFNQLLLRFLHPSAFIFTLPLRVVALAVEEAEFIFAQLGVGDLDLYFAVFAVGLAVGGGVGDEVL